MTKGLVLDIQRMSTEDGPGLRTTAFLKGCNLKCSWCHNPESISPYATVLWHRSKCMGCMSCIDACPNSAISSTDKGIKIDRALCKNSFACAEECPAAALIVKGVSYTVDELFNELIKDKEYFESANGGVTLSGGEALLQKNFCIELLKLLKENDVHTAVDTAGHLDYKIIKAAAEYTDLFLYDLKLADKAEHIKHTGATNSLLIDNLKKLTEDAKEIWIRTPIIPDATDSEENIRQIATIIQDISSDKITRWELCAFNNLCINKYEMLDVEWEYKNYPLIKQSTLDSLTNIAKSILKNKNIVYSKGMTK